MVYKREDNNHHLSSIRKFVPTNLLHTEYTRLVAQRQHIYLVLFSHKLPIPIDIYSTDCSELNTSGT